MIQTPWAVLLCKFRDDDSEPFPKSFYEALFTQAGAGTQNMVDFFRDNSHGTLDLSGSQVFGWFTLDQKRSDYIGSGPIQAGRQALIGWAKQKATAAGVNLAAFFGVVVSMNVQTDLFGTLGGGSMVCDLASLQPSLLGQEMGHGYGLDHSRRDGSTADYQDLWDAMSTASAYEAPHPKYGFIGPTLNAVNMESRGWLDQSRVWTASGAGSHVVQLRPLVRRDLPGFLAARAGDFLIEFRVNAGWDAGIPEPVVLVHRFEDNHSYVMAGSNGEPGLTKGGVFERGSAQDQFDRHLKLEVLDIDSEGRTATVGILDRPAQQPPVDGPARVFGGVAVDGGGFAIIGGRVVPIPPRSPLVRILEQLAAVQESELVADPAVRGVVRQGAFSVIAREAQAQVAALGPVRQPAPRVGRTG
jgi:hypothetical protein